MTETIKLISRTRREWAKTAVDSAPDGWECVVREAKRSTDQNAKMWAMLTDVSRSKPGGRDHPKEVWKAVFMHALGHQTKFYMGLDGSHFPAGLSSSHLNKSQMADLITFIQQWGDESGVEWSDE